MKSNNKYTLKNNILLYLVIFSITILLFLWLFQIVFLNTYYKIDKTKVIQTAISTISNKYNKENYTEILNQISQKNDVCIDLIYDGMIVYSTSNYNDKCMSKDNKLLTKFQLAFISQDLNKESIEIVNPAYNNKTLLTGQKINDNTYVFVNASLVPLDNSISILKRQFIYVALIILFISVWISYFISRRISRPITKLNESAKRLGEKDYNVVFPSEDSILEISELATTLNNTTKELAKTDELRRELMANVSHDLKTPLTMIKAYAEAARDLNSNNKKKREENLNIIIDETERLNILVNDILELSKIESNAYPLEIQTFNLTDMINAILKRYDILLKDGYNFVFDAKEKIIVEADPKRIEQVIYNLINNAINYTGKDKKITIEIINKDKTVRIEIIDTGNGIAKEELELIWEKYYRIDKHYKRNKFGTGLGLSIVKGILKSHNFPYGVTSKKNKGTTFYFEINKPQNIKKSQPITKEKPKKTKSKKEKK